MNTSHRHFEVLCALAACGQLTKPEHAQLREHSGQCNLCRERLAEMHQLGTQLFLAQAYNTGSKRSPKSMRERFAARAVSEGVPLSSQSAGVGPGALGCVAVVLLALLLVAHALKNETYQAAASRASVVLSKRTPPAQTSSQNSPIQVRRGRLRKAGRTTSPVPYTTRHEQLSPVELAALQNRKFLFVPYSRDSGAHAYPYSATMKVAGSVPSPTFPNRAPRLTFDASSLALPHFIVQGFRAGLDLSAYKANINGFNFETAPFRSIQRDFPQAMQPEKGSQ